jgi:hypothetical protein
MHEQVDPQSDAQQCTRQGAIVHGKPPVDHDPLRRTDYEGAGPIASRIGPEMSRTDLRLH